MSDISKYIKNIARTGELKRSIEQLQKSEGRQQKAAIPSTRSIAYVNASGGVSSVGTSSSGGTGSSQNVGKEYAVNSGADGGDAKSGGGGSAEQSGSATDKKNSNAYEWTAEELLSTGAQIGDIVNAITGLLDCSSGTAANLRLDGLGVPPIITGYDGYGYFDDAADDPRNEQFVQGIFYTAPGGQKADNPWAAVDAYLPALDAADPPNAPHVISNVPSYDPLTDSNVNVGVSRADGVSFDVAVSITAPGSCTVGVDAWCPTSPSINQWPEQDEHQLIFDGGQFTTPPLQNSSDDMPQFLNSPSKVSGCTSGGNAVSVEAAGNGSKQVTFDTGDVYVIGADGVIKSAPTI